MKRCKLCGKLLSEHEEQEKYCEGCGYDANEEDTFDPQDNLDDDDEWLKDQEIKEEYGKGDE
jgi:hypothetical protein